MNIFEIASKSKLRFNTSKGQLCAESLWDLNLAALDQIAKSINKVIKEKEEDSFIPNARKKSSTTEHETALEIVKHIIGVKVQEKEDAANRADKHARLAKLKELASHKADEALGAQSLDDLNKMIAELEKE